MGDWRIRAGTLLGLVGFVLAGSLCSPAGISVEHGPLLSDCDGRIEKLVIHYVSDAAGVVQTAYRQFLSRLDPDVTVHVVCPARADFEDLRRRVGPVACRLVPVVTGHPITAWAIPPWQSGLSATAPGQSNGPTSPPGPGGCSTPLRIHAVPTGTG